MRAGVLVGLVPLVVVSGGPSAYWRVFYNQGAEDLTGVAMLATTPTLRPAGAGASQNHVCRAVGLLADRNCGAALWRRLASSTCALRARRALFVLAWRSGPT